MSKFKYRSGMNIMFMNEDVLISFIDQVKTNTYAIRDRRITEMNN
ncbi:hypothetical protein NST74_19345 [Paenibacillus sp. FSL F4-0125]